jgi:murein DD-endopeptidase MepM/ murein hydrolase activator NlpD
MRHHTMSRSMRALCALILSASVSLAPVVANAATAKQLHDQLNAVKAEFAKAGQSWHKASSAVENADYKIKLTDARMKKERKKMRRTEKYLGRRAYAIYIGGGDAEFIGFLLGADTFEDFASRLEYAEIIAKSDASLIKSLKDSRVRLEVQRMEQERAKKERVKEAGVAKKSYDEAQKKMNAATVRYNKLLAALQAAMAREAAANNITYQPNAPGGMVFPVRGPNTYGNTWGAARSGGRRHKGTDIMAPRGAPCVAIVSGTVNAHYNGLGGNSITLRGDNGWQFYYAHLDRYVVRSGRVSAGQVIGTVGSTGNAGSCNHLHLQMGPGGNWVNPYPYLRSME